MEEFETSWKPETGSYSRKFLEFCSAKALADMCRNLKEDICNGSFSRFSFDMMLAWEMPSTEAEESREVRAQTHFYSIDLVLKFSIRLVFSGSIDLV